MASNTKKIRLQTSEVKPELKAVNQEVAGSPVCAVDEQDDQGYTPLHMIFIKSDSPEHDEETMKMLVSFGADINTKAIDGSGIFHSAVKNNIPAKLLESFVNLCNAKVPVKGIKQEIENTAKSEFPVDINGVNDGGFTPMHWIAMNRGDSNNNKALLKLLLRLGANINSKTKNEETVLHLAIVKNTSIEIVQELLAAGVNINSQTKDGLTALSLAVKKNRPTKDGSTALFLAVKGYRSTIGIIEALLKGDCEVNLKIRNGFTALHLSLNNIHSDDKIIKALVRSGADVKFKTSNGSTALHLAVQNRRSEAVTGDIINAGAKMEAVDAFGKTALHYTYTMSFSYEFEKINLATLLVKHGARFDVLDDQKYTPLLVSVITNQTDLVLVMMDAAKGCDRNLEAIVPQSFNNRFKNSFGSRMYTEVKGYTALLVAVIRLDVAMVEASIHAGASVNALTPDKKNALHVILDKYSASNEKEKEACISIAKLLIDSGIDMDGIYFSQTALHMAVTRSEEITKYLIEKGANVNIKNSQGVTILHCAIQNNKHDIIKLLFKP